MTLGLLAARTGLSLGHLSKLERGLQVPGVGTLRTIARTFGVEVVDLITDPAASPRHAAIAATAHMTVAELRQIARPSLRAIEGGGETEQPKKRRASRDQVRKGAVRIPSKGRDSAG